MHRVLTVLLCYLLVASGARRSQAGEPPPWLYVYTSSSEDDEDFVSAKIALEIIQPVMTLRGTRKVAMMHGAVVVQLLPEDANELTKLCTGLEDAKAQKRIYFTDVGHQIIALFETLPKGVVRVTLGGSKTSIGGAIIPPTRFSEDMILFSEDNKPAIDYLCRRFGLNPAMP